MNPKLSIVIPCYNVEKYLDRCIESIVKQTIKDIEIILVNDNSSDLTAEICDKWTKKDSRIKVVHKSQNEGLGMACNSGIDLAIGEYIAFCDSDDYVDSDMYKSMYNAAKEYNADAVFTGIKSVDQSGNISPMNDYPELKIVSNSKDMHSFIKDMIASAPEDTIERHIAMSAKIVLYKRNIINDNKLRFVSERKLICEDLIWNIDFLNHCSNIVALPNTYYYYYCNTNSLSKKIRTDRFIFFKYLRTELYDKCINHYKMPIDTKTRIDRMFIGYSRFYILNLIKSNLPAKEKKNILSSISDDVVWKELLDCYPIYRMPLVHRILLYLIIYNCYRILLVITKIKD